ncbi:MAG: DUF2911 domain-containing protein, partial [Ferruginibacter sp.]
MKKIIVPIAFLFCTGLAEAQVKMPAPSSTQTIKQDFALGAIELTYSRPSAKGRKVYGDLVPFNTIWRTGANSATLLKFTDAVEMNGKKIDTGSYALYTIPGDDTWEIILNKGTTNWGTTGYAESADVVRMKVPSEKMKMPLETFTMQFANITPESCDLQIMWEKTMVSVPIKSNVKERIRMQMETALMGEKKPYWQAAQFYYDMDKNNAKALENVTKAVGENPKAYYMWLLKARIEKDMGDKTAAMASSARSLELARDAKNDDYIKMNMELQKKM